MKIGAAAWMTAVRPESSRVSAKPSSQNGTSVVERAEDERAATRCPRSGEAPPRSATSGSSTSTPTTSRPSTTADGLELVDPELDEEKRRAPDRRETEEQSGSRRLTSRNANGRASRPVRSGAAGPAARLSLWAPSRNSPSIACSASRTGSSTVSVDAARA